MPRPSVRRRTFPALALVAAVAATAAAFGTAAAQDAAKDTARDTAQDASRGKRKAPPTTHFFDTQDPLQLTFTANLSRLRKDISEKVPWRRATLAYAGPDGRQVTVPITVRTRGFWRLKRCEFPPLRLNFGAKAAAGTVFEGLDKPKLVNYCRDDDRYEQYILQEFQLYRVHALLAPLSHRARLVRMTYVDSASGKVHATRYAFLLEEPKSLAARAGGRLVEDKGAGATDFEPFNAALTGVFQYFIGNSDWSTASLHNAEIVEDSSFRLFLVPYDFDFAGAVNTTYAAPDSLLPIRSVRQRIFRGHCAPPEEFAKVFALFNEKKGAIYALYADPIGRLLKPKIAKETLEYFDEFYETINSPRKAKHDIIEACQELQ